MVVSKSGLSSLFDRVVFQLLFGHSVVPMYATDVLSALHAFYTGSYDIPKSFDEQANGMTD